MKNLEERWCGVCWVEEGGEGVVAGGWAVFAQDGEREGVDELEYFSGKCQLHRQE